MTDDGPRRNKILAALPDAEFSALEPHLRLEYSELKHPAYEPGKPITHIYFPLTSVYSVVAMANGRFALEVATVGKEGMVGLPVYLGAATSPHAAFCQVPGDTAHISVAEFHAALGRGGALHALLNRFTQATMVLVAQNVVCDRSHSTLTRMARYLAITHDRVGRDQFALTQKFLGQMLGVHRATVSETAQQLAARGMIRYSRGSITITDREQLERTGCGCYQLIKAEFDDIGNQQP